MCVCARRGGLVVVGDLMRSVSLLSYNAEQGVLEHRAADYNSGWTTAVEVRGQECVGVCGQVPYIVRQRVLPLGASLGVGTSNFDTHCSRE